ncbi:copper amine oxidase N-terminal domain-containing protein [Aureibacillus halotolerans]|uniref:Copper amine oxidase-like protein n=1 Tax=Aureibacillus halotolerans TaxID=1508390 RepID=A0A4R6TRT8_9BACI|nr:copper amine oxidase N-terminal domain-containing protein [Aureibacillus halotolerans]TDQ34745.1 copper amine oxidase-like protein [Aureibacillus halotolerans]
MKMKRALLILSAGLMLSATPTIAEAHPGRTDANGGHHCWTNCEKWGLEYGEYHYHNGKSTSSSSKPAQSTPIPTVKPVPKPTTPAVKTVKVYLNGALQSYSQPAIVQSGRTLVPLRPIFEALGATVQYDAETRIITAVKEDRTVTLTVGSAYAKVNGTTITLDAKAQVIKGNTMVPLRFVSEAMGATVQFDGQVKISN